MIILVEEVETLLLVEAEVGRKRGLEKEQILLAKVEYLEVELLDCRSDGDEKDGVTSCCWLGLLN